MKKYIFLSIFLLTLMSCQKLFWNNPFDPNCPKDYWSPTNFKAVQEGLTIKLNWIQTVNQIDGFKLGKTVDGIQTGDLNIEKGMNQYVDGSITEGGKIHSYTLIATAGSNQSNSVTAQVRPILAAGGVTTNFVGTITALSAVSGGSITTDGGSPISARGVCWATTSNPTIAGSKTTDGTGTGSFTSTMTGLLSNTNYFVRAYAINAAGTTYGNEFNFRTLNGISMINTIGVSNITTTTGTSGGNITNDGGAAITARGVCWGATTSPTISGNKTTDGTGIGTFTSSLTGLIPNTTYYVRAYSTNSVGTIYGNEVTFKTSANPPSVTTTNVTSVGKTTATGGGNVTSDGSATVTARGVCWSTTSSPTISGNKTSDGTGVGSFSSSITGLLAATTYYLRAYATNSVGTSYGNEISFTTDPPNALGISINFNDKPITLYSGLAADGPYQLNGYTYPYVTIVFGLEGTLNFTYHTAVVQNNSGSMTNPIWWGLGGIGGEEADMGIVSGLGNVVTKPTTGYTPNRAIQVGHGYVIRYKKSKDLTSPTLPYLYARVYVTDLLKNTTGVTIGVILKYETSF
ncbi:MAG: hypothetical protein WCK18_05725 [Prolixibacteraceae bacterium]